MSDGYSFVRERSFYEPWAGDPYAGWAFSNPPLALVGLREYAETHGLDWTTPVARTRYHLDALRIQWWCRPWERWCSWRDPLEVEREEIVESIPWAD